MEVARVFWPLREIVLQAAGERGRAGVVDLLAGEDDGRSIAAQIAGPIGLGEKPGRVEELFPAVRRLLQVLANRQPLVVIFEDVHWAQPMLLDLVEYLAGSTHAAALFLCLARPELAEQRHAWTQDRDYAAAMFLEPLGRNESEKLIASRSAGSVLPPEAVERVVDMAQGNPLFVEQLLAMLREERELSIPPSVHALLAARSTGSVPLSVIFCVAPPWPESSSRCQPSLRLFRTRPTPS